MILPPHQPDESPADLARLLDMPERDTWVLVTTAAPIPNPKKQPRTTLHVTLKGSPLPLAISVPTSELKLGTGCLVRLCGRRMDRLPEPGEWPAVTLPLGPGFGIVVQLWLQRAWRPGSSLAARIAWAPDKEGERSIRVLEREWDDDQLRAAGKALRFLDVYTRRPGPKRGFGAKYPTLEGWHAALRREVLPRRTRRTADDETIASWLDIGKTTLYEILRRPGWTPSNMVDLREGNF